MKHEVDYSIFHDGAVARRQAINDLIDYIGKKKTGALIRYARSGRGNPDLFLFLASLAGVEGFPVRALWAYASGRDQDMALLSHEVSHAAME